MLGQTKNNCKIQIHLNREPIGFFLVDRIVTGFYTSLVYIHARVYVCMCVCIYVQMRVCMYVCLYVCVGEYSSFIE